MPLVSYSSSSSSSSDSSGGEESREPKALERKRNRTTAQDTPSPDNSKRPAALPSLPASFHDLYATGARVSTHDDPSLHGGRKRAVPHVQGQWPSHVYLEWLPSPSESAQFRGLLLRHPLTVSTGQALSSLVTSPLGVPLPLHVSLSAPLSLSTAQRAPFLASLVRHLRYSTPPVCPFQVSFDGLKWVSNEDRTRWFLVLKVTRPHGDELNTLLKVCNAVAKKHNLKRLYVVGAHGDEAPPPGDYTEFFHFSIAWSLDAPPAAGDQETEVAGEEALAQVKTMRVGIDSVKVKIGDAVTSLALDAKGLDSTGILA